MKRTRRAALAMIAGSSGLLAIETFGYSSGRVEREVNVDVVDDADAYLGLDEGMDDSGLLFDGPRTSPATFAVRNQLAERVDVTFELDGNGVRLGRLEDGKLRTGVGIRSSVSLEPGEEIGGFDESDGLAVDLNPSVWIPDGDERTGRLTISAEGNATAIAADRTFTLRSDLIASIDVPWTDTVVAVRKRGTNGEGTRLVVEAVDRTMGDTRHRREAELEAAATLLLRLRGDTGANDESPTAASRDDIESADDVEATLRWPGEDANGSADESESDDGGSNGSDIDPPGREFAVHIDPDTTTEEDGPTVELDVRVDR